MSEENKVIIRRFADEFVNDKDMAVFDDLVSRDVKAHSVPPGVTPDFEGWKGVLGMVLGALPDTHMTAEDVIATDDKVMLRYTWKATHSGELMGIPATGKSVKFTGMIMQRIAGGKIVEHWEQIDMMGLMQQLGAIPTPGE